MIARHAHNTFSVSHSVSGCVHDVNNHERSGHRQPTTDNAAEGGTVRSSRIRSRRNGHDRQRLRRLLSLRRRHVARHASAARAIFALRTIRRARGAESRRAPYHPRGRRGRGSGRAARQRAAENRRLLRRMHERDGHLPPASRPSSRARPHQQHRRSTPSVGSDATARWDTRRSSSPGEGSY